MSAYEGVADALRTMMRVGDDYASNVARSNVDGAQGTKISVDEAGAEIGSSPALSVSQTNRDLSQGALVSSSSPTDLAIQGSGNFLLFDTTGNLYTTRNGNFNFNSAGELVNQQGLFVASFDPGTNVIGKTTKDTVAGVGTSQPDDHIEFNANGQLINLSQGNALGRQLALADTANPQGMTAGTYAGTFTASETSGALSVGRAGQNGLGMIAPQALEQSNISSGQSLADLAVFKGTFEATTAALKALGSAIDDLVAQFKPA